MTTTSPRAAAVPESIIAERDVHQQVEQYLHRMFYYLPEPNRSMVAHLIGNGVMDVVKNGLKPLEDYEREAYRLPELDTEL